MAVRLTSKLFPCDAALKDAVGLPWGCVVQPFAAAATIEPPPPSQAAPPARLTDADLVARCEECFAYINGCCTIERFAWRCSLCDTDNTFSDSQLQRYGSRDRLAACEELRNSLVELDVAAEDAAGGGGAGGGDFYTRPVYIAAVDLSSTEDFLELVKSSLLATLEALSPSALFGLATFGPKLGLYDVQGGGVPVVKSVAIPPQAAGAGIALDLEDVLPLEALLAPVGANKEHIAGALETLRPLSSLERQTGGGGGTDRAAAHSMATAGGSGGRGFGAAMEALLKYLGADGGSTFVSARIFAFLSGPPDYGLGQLDGRSSHGDSGRLHDGEGGDDSPLAAAATVPAGFYADLAAQSVQAGVCIDLVVVSTEPVGLAALKPLSLESGGHVLLYSSTEDSTLPQDFYRLLSRPHAISGILRLRTTPEFRVAKAYGHFFEDAQYESVQHVISCDPFDTFAFDFEFTSNNGFSRWTPAQFGKPREKIPLVQPILQLAFQYTVMLPIAADDEDGGESNVEASRWRPAGGSPVTPRRRRIRHVLRRRLRLRTLRVGVANSPAELFEAADPESTLSLLTHKARPQLKLPQLKIGGQIIQASLEQGVKEGRLLLNDWLVILTANYNEHYQLAQSGNAASYGLLDASFLQCPPLQPMPRLVFGLLRSPLLQMSAEGIHSDVRTYLQCLYSALDPASLLRAVYPVLSSFASPDKLAFPRHSLSRAALVTSGSPIFLLDAFTTLIVYYAPSATADMPFPPPHDSLLRNTINQLKQDRSVTPKLHMIRSGHDDARPFEHFLIEEQDVDGASSGGGTGFVAFLEQVTQNVREYMQS
eukprot:SM000076S21823  [mRNA]  locus=s76:484591:488610:+ [translate_table: standard]